jgi:hypothetical protein
MVAGPITNSRQKSMALNRTECLERQLEAKPVQGAPWILLKAHRADHSFRTATGIALMRGWPE